MKGAVVVLSRTACLLAWALGAPLGCGGDDASGATEPGPTAGTASGHGTGATGGTAGAVSAAGTDGPGGTSGTGGSGAPNPGNPAEAGALADAAIDATGAVPWWTRAVWKPVDWSPGQCVVSVVDDPAVIEPLQWKPMTFGSLAGQTPVVPLGHYYAELPDGTSWAGGRLASGEVVVAVRDPDGVPRMGFKHANCQFQLATTRRGVCALFIRIVGEPAALACGDLLAPDPLIELPQGGFIAAFSDELVLVRGGPSNSDLNIVDLSDDSVTATTVPGDELGEATAHGRGVFAVYKSSEPTPWHGILFAWDGADGYEPLWNPLPLQVVNVHADATDLIWTETEVGLTFTGTSIYRAALPVSAASLSPVLVRKVEGRAADDSSALGAGLLATQTDEIELVRIADGARWKVDPTEPWQVTGRAPFINDRSLGFQMFDRNDPDQSWVTFRANLDDVLALPSD